MNKGEQVSELESKSETNAKEFGTSGGFESNNRKGDKIEESERKGNLSLGGRTNKSVG